MAQRGGLVGAQERWETCGSARWYRHRKDGVPRKLGAQ